MPVQNDYEKPLTHVHFRAEGDMEFRTLLYIPERAPPNFLNDYYGHKAQLKLYVRRVFISDDFEELIPRHETYTPLLRTLRCTSCDSNAQLSCDACVVHLSLLCETACDLVRSTTAPHRHTLPLTKVTRVRVLMGHPAAANGAKQGRVEQSQCLRPVACLCRYLSFLKGIVDSDTLPLSVSRETLQAHASLKVIKKKIVRKVLDSLKKLSDAEKEGADAGTSLPLLHHLVSVLPSASLWLMPSRTSYHIAA